MKTKAHRNIWQLRWERFKRNRTGFVSLVLFACVFILSLAAELITNEKPLVIVYKSNLYFPILFDYPETTFGGALKGKTQYNDPFIQEELHQHAWTLRPPLHFSHNTIRRDKDAPFPSPPDRENILGTDENGKDIFATILYGFRISVVFGFLLTFASISIGIIVGALLGFHGGKLDFFGQRFMEILGGFPVTYLIIIMGSFIVPSFWLLLGIMLLFGWMGPANLVRTEFLKARKQPYIIAVKALGVGDTGIIFRHILPNAMVATLTFLPFMLAGSITILTSLDFLGVGLPAEYPALGALLAQGKNNLFAPWIGLSAFGFLSFILILLLFIGDAVRDAFDPHAIGKGNSK